MFKFADYIKSYLAQPGQNDAQNYGAYVLAATKSPSYRCIGIHHLTPNENAGNHNIYIDVLDQDGARNRTQQVGWTWDGRRPDENAPLIALDKAEGEPSANLPLAYNQTIALWIDQPDNGHTDIVAGLHTRHPDEGNGNTLGHHSYYVVFQYTDAPAPTPEPPAPPVEEPEPPAPPLAQIKLALKSARNTVTQLEAMLPKAK